MIDSAPRPGPRLAPAHRLANRGVCIMVRNWWQRFLPQQTKLSKRALRKPAKRWERPRYAPRTEQLEDRTLLSTLNIDGSGNLTYLAGAGIANSLTIDISA